MEGTPEPEAREAAPWSPRRRWTTGIVALVLVGLFVFAPRPVLRIVQTNEAHQLIDTLAEGREELLAKQEVFRAPLAQLGEPVRAWTEVGCTLTPRYSDGDGEQDVVMFYWQQCSLQAYEVYSVPEEIGDGAAVAEWLGGSTAGDPTCGAIVFDVLTPDVGAVGMDEYAPNLWWADPDGTPPADEPDRCELAAPGGPSTAHTTIDIDEAVTAHSYLVYTVRSPVAATDVGCDHMLASWLGPCAGEPAGFPVV